MNRFWQFLGAFIPGTTVRAQPVNDKFAGIDAGFELVEAELDRSIRMPNSYSGNRNLPESDPRECLLFVNASNQLEFYPMATFTAAVNEVAIKHADVVSRHSDIVTRHNNIISRHADITTKHDYVASVANSPAVGALLPLTPVANGLPYYTSGSAAALATISAFGRSLIDDADAATARATLGAQAADATLTALAGATTAANKLAYFSGVDAVAMADLTPFARTLLDDADAAAARATLGLGTAATATVTTSLTDVTAGSLMKVGDFGIGGIAPLLTDDNLNDANVGGIFLTAITPTSIPPGWNGSSRKMLLNAAGAPYAGQILIGQNGSEFGRLASRSRSAAGVWSPWREAVTSDNAAIGSIASLTPAADRLPYYTSGSAAALATLTAFARTLLDDADAATARATLGAYGGTLGTLWTGSHVVANSPNTSNIALSSFPADGVLHIQYLYGTQYGSFALPYSKNGSFEQRFAIGAGYVSIVEITSALIRFQATDISGSVTITQIWAQV